MQCCRSLSYQFTNSFSGFMAYSLYGCELYRFSYYQLRMILLCSRNLIYDLINLFVFSKIKIMNHNLCNFLSLRCRDIEGRFHHVAKLQLVSHDW